MSVEQLRSKAKKMLLDGKYQKALPLFEELHQAEPKDLRTYVKLAELRERTGDSEGAIKDYIAIAGSYAEQGFVVQAIAINKIILRLNPDRIEIKERLKALSSERGDDWAISTIVSQNHMQSRDISAVDRAKLSFERTPLLSSLSGEELESFMDSLTLKDFSTNECIYEQGVPGDILYLIGMGSVRLETALSSGGKRVFSRLSEGDFFGEQAFMSRANHHESAVAEGDVSVLMIDRSTFDAWVKKDAKIKGVVESFYRQRVLARVLAITPIFEGVPASARAALADKFELHSFKKGDVVISEGDVGESFFLIRSGKVQVSTCDAKHHDRSIVLGELSDGSFFGEVALLTDKPRTATVIATTDLELMELTRAKFNDIANEYTSVRKVVEAYQKQRVQEAIRILMKRDA